MATAGGIDEQLSELQRKIAVVEGGILYAIKMKNRCVIELNTLVTNHSYNPNNPVVAMNLRTLQGEINTLDRIIETENQKLINFKIEQQRLNDEQRLMFNTLYSETKASIPPPPPPPSSGGRRRRSRSRKSRKSRRRHH